MLAFQRMLAPTLRGARILLLVLSGIWTYDYFPDQANCGGPPSGSSFGGRSTSTDPNGHPTTYCWDSNGKVFNVIDALGHSRQTSYTSNYNVSTLTDSVSQVTRLNYDNNNNLTQIQAPASGSGQTAASSFLSYRVPGQTYLPSSTTDAQGNCRAFTYSGPGNLSDVYDGQASAGNPPQCDGQTGGAHLHNAYQGEPGVNCGGRPGQLCWTRDAKNNTTSYGYDAQGNLTRIGPPAPLNPTTIVPDPVSRVSSVTDGNGRTTTYIYDRLDRIKQVLYDGAGECVSPDTCTTFNYDNDGNLLSRSDNTGSTGFSYDPLNRVTGKQLPESSVACAGSDPPGLVFGYDGVGNLTSYCDSGGTVSYGYDAVNRQTALAEPGGSLDASGQCSGYPCSSFSYDDNDRRKQVTFPGGASLNLDYDNSGNQTREVGQDASGNVLTSFVYSYQQGSNDRQLRQSVREQDGLAVNRTTSYTYDRSNRLTDAVPNDGSASYHYRYDANGNRCRTDTTGCQGGSDPYQYNPANQLTSSPGVSSWSYDGAGNLTGNSAGASLGYNAKNQTTSMTYGQATIDPIVSFTLMSTRRSAFRRVGSL
jgi:YD repeat-containing protein